MKDEKNNLKENQVFGAFCANRWKDSNRFYGSSSNFLFTITPELKIIRSKSGSNQHFQWLNTRTHGFPHGFGLGGSIEQFRFFITDNMEQNIATSSCLTFESGKIISGNPIKDEFEILALEVWGTGGEILIQKGLEAQSKDREIRDESIKRAQKCDKAAFFNSGFDQEFLLSNTMKHKQEAQDR